MRSNFLQPGLFRKTLHGALDGFTLHTFVALAGLQLRCAHPPDLLRGQRSCIGGQRDLDFGIDAYVPEGLPVWVNHS